MISRKGGCFSRSLGRTEEKAAVSFANRGQKYHSFRETTRYAFDLVRAAPLSPRAHYKRLTLGSVDMKMTRAAKKKLFPKLLLLLPPIA